MVEYQQECSDVHLRSKGWMPSPARHKCANRDRTKTCNNANTWVRDRDNWTEGGIDYEVKCFGCGYRYMVDGPDA